MKNASDPRRNIKIAPSILSADFCKMGIEVERMEKAGADLIHCDVMDGEFVPNITFGPKMIQDIRKHTSLELDVHLMIDRPERYIQRFIDAGADYVTIHFEATTELLSTLEKIKQSGVKCGAVISPDTDVRVLMDALPLCDMVLLMSVYPGFGGQKFIEASYDRLKTLRRLMDQLNPSALLEIDGGVCAQNAANIIESGANVLVAGNAVFSAPDCAAAIRQLRGQF